MTHRRQFEERSGCDPSIVGRRIYRVGSEEYLGIARASWRNGAGTCMISIDIGDAEQRPVFIAANVVLVEVYRQTPHIDAEAPPPAIESPPPERASIQQPPGDDTTEGLDSRDHSGYSIFSSPERERIFNQADLLGAELDAREPGVASDDNTLPLADEPDPPPNQLRPAGPVLDEDERPTDVTIHPRGRPLGRRAEERPNSAPTGGAPTQTGGSTMASVGEVKAAIDAANQTADEAVAAARVAIEKLNEAQQQLAAALEGGHHDSITTAVAALQHASQQFEEGIQAVAGSVEASGQYGAGL